MQKPVLLCSVVLSLAFATVSASGAVITFGTISGPAGSSYSGHVEAGYTVTDTAGLWFQAFTYGNSAPSIFAGPVGEVDVSAIEVARTSRPFHFRSLDYSSNNGASEYNLQGFLEGVLVFSHSGDLAASVSPFGFRTLSGLSGSAIDALVITVTPTADVSSVNLDNISLTEVPEPGTFLPLAAGNLLIALKVRALRRC